LQLHYTVTHADVIQAVMWIPFTEITNQDPVHTSSILALCNTSTNTWKYKHQSITTPNKCNRKPAPKHHPNWITAGQVESVLPFQLSSLLWKGLNHFTSKDIYHLHLFLEKI